MRVPSLQIERLPSREGFQSLSATLETLGVSMNLQPETCKGKIGSWSQQRNGAKLKFS